MVTWRDVGSAVRFEIYGKPDGAAPEAWVAVGFSADTRMVSAIFIIHLSTSETHFKSTLHHTVPTLNQPGK